MPTTSNRLRSFQSYALLWKMVEHCACRVTKNTEIKDVGKVSKVLVTGAHGLVGSECVRRYCEQGFRVVGIDNDFRSHMFGAEASTHHIGRQLFESYPNYTPYEFDIRDRAKVEDLYKTHGAQDLILHCAAAPAHEWAQAHALDDFEINALGTMNMLELFRQHSPDAVFVQVSTSKVYGDHVNELPFVEMPTRFDLPLDHPFYAGVDESMSIEGCLHSLFGACFDDTTEILTTEGWKLFLDLRGDEQVATVNQHTQEIEFQEILQLHQYDYNGAMAYQDNRRLQFKVTPNHKLFVAWHRSEGRLVNPKLVEAADCFNKPVCHLIGADYSENAVSDLEFMEIGERRIPIDTFLRFFGLYISDGSFYKTAQRNYNVTLHTRSRHADYAALFAEMGFNPILQKGSVFVSDKALFEYVSQFGKAHEKFVPTEFKRLPVKRLRVLIDYMCIGDGDKRVRENDTSRYSSVSRQLADDFQEICLLCGMSAHISAGEKPKLWSHHQIYRVFFSESRVALCNLPDGKHEKWVPYKGKIYCVSVKNETVLTRYNGYPFVSGNSKAAGDLMAQEYGRYLGLKVGIFRPVCITGKNHQGAPLHGYLAYLVKCIADGTLYTVNGYDGKQVRDNIHAFDLVAAFDEVFKNPDAMKNDIGTYGEVFNMGAGRASNNSIREAIAWAERYFSTRVGTPPHPFWRGNVAYSDENRRGDHKWCIFSTAKFRSRYPDWRITYDNARLMTELCDANLASISK